MKQFKAKRNKTEETKAETPKNIQILSFGQFSLAGINPNKPEKVNQDSAFVINSTIGLVCGVADGHGFYGEKVSNFITNSIPLLLTQPIPSIFSTLNTNLTNQNFDTNYSGSTLSLIIINDKLTVTNVGDSQVLLGSLIESNKNKVQWSTSLLSKIHNPDDREEALRISKAGGRITWGSPNRIWLRNQDVPGLAVTRALGDTIAQQIGVLYDPFVCIKQLTHSDKWILICTDGVTDVLDYKSIEKLMTGLWKTKNAQMACEIIVNTAREKWKTEVVDDITCVVVFINVE